MIDTDTAEQILQGDDTHPDILQALGLEMLAEVKRFRKMCLDEMVCYDCLSDLYKAGLSDENPVDAYWCGMCSEPMKGLIE